MRFVLAGIITFLLYSAAFAGVLGKVDSIGFESHIRADCWVPLLIQITSDAAGPEDYQLQVVQNDIDGDEVVYARPLLVNPDKELVWTYFKPESINGGLPSGLTGNSQDLTRRLRIYLAAPDGSKRIAQISVAGRMPTVLDDGEQSRGDKLIVCVGRRPNVTEFDPSAGRVFGLAENVQFASADLRRLPDNVLGYDAVDAVVWTDAEADKLTASQFRALRQYVRHGGKLVVLQNPEIARGEKFSGFLPVRVSRVESSDSQEPLKSLMHPLEELKRPPDPKDPSGQTRLDPFRATRGPYRLARADALPESIVDSWITWPDGTRTPYIARHIYGTGMVAWVAQDISDPSIRDVIWGWPNFWARVFDWPVVDSAGGTKSFDLPIRAETAPRPGDAKDKIKNTWTAAGTRDIGASYIDKLDLDSKTAALISLAFLFFIAYWLIAGPGAYLVLVAKKRPQWSWFIFGATAVVATLLTVVIAQLVLRGNAQVRHVSMVRVRSDGTDPALVQSRFGIYLPQDRPDTEIALNGREPNGRAIITPLSFDPHLFSPTPNTRDSRYTIQTLNEDAGEQVITEVPFRSTLKKLQATWTGPPPGRVSGNARLVEQSVTIGGKPAQVYITGSLSNNTGRDLSNVILVFSFPRSSGPEDMLLYLRSWRNGETVELDKLTANADRSIMGDITLDGDKPKLYTLSRAADFLYRNMRASFTMNDWKWEVSKDAYRQSFPIASLYDRLAPMRNDKSVDRVDVLRRGVRNWDISGAIAGGGLVVLAQSNNDTIPLPLTVEGDAPEGTGTTFWQFVLPLDRSQVNQPTTQPTTLPTTPLTTRLTTRLTTQLTTQEVTN